MSTTPPATTLTKSKARIIPFSIPLSDGTADVTTTATVSSMDPKVKAVMNPSNNREFAVVGLDVTIDATVTVACGGRSSFLQFTVALPPAPSIQAPVFGTPGPEIDPPSWAV